MNKKLIISFTVILTLLSINACEKDGQSLIIRNNSSKEVIATFSRDSTENECFKPVTSFEYEDFIYYNAIRANSNKNFERIASVIMSTPNDTYIYIIA